jgi:hypothetical protein
MCVGSISGIHVYDQCRSVIESWTITRWGHMSTSEMDPGLGKKVANLKDANPDGVIE